MLTEAGESEGLQHQVSPGSVCDVPPGERSEGYAEALDALDQTHQCVALPLQVVDVVRPRACMQLCIS